MLPLLQANMCCIAKQKYMTFSLQNGLREKYTCSIYLRKPQYTKYHKETENLVKMIYQCFLLKTEFIPSYFFTQNSPITSHLINLKDWFHVVGKWSDLALSILVSSPTYGSCHSFCCKHRDHLVSPSSGPSHLLFSLPGILFPITASWFTFSILIVLTLLPFHFISHFITFSLSYLSLRGTV